MEEEWRCSVYTLPPQKKYTPEKKTSSSIPLYAKEQFHWHLLYAILMRIYVYIYLLIRK